MPFDDSKTYQGGTAADDAGTVNFFNSFRFQYGTLANRPAAGNQGVFYYATDTKVLSYDTGAAWVDLPVAVVSAGTYTGDDTENRAIAHGLGAAPKMVVIMLSSGIAIFHIFSDYAFIHYNYSNIGGGLAVTAMNATNFYVGNATNYDYSANKNAENHAWKAFK